MGEYSNKYITGKSSQDKGRSMKDDLMRSLRDRRKVLTAEKRDTESRMPKAQREAVNAYEDRVSKLRTERMGLIDEGGQILLQSDKGSRRRTTLHLPYQGYTAPNAVMTHNHPTDFKTDSLAARVNNTFSPQDLKSAATLNVKALRVRTQGGYVYQLERNGDRWPNPDQLAREMNALDHRYIAENGDKTFKAVTRKLVDARMRGDIREYNRLADLYNARYNVAGQHRAMKELAKKYGLRYTYRKA